MYILEIYHYLFPTVPVHPVRQKKIASLLAFINTQGGASFFPIFVKASTTYTYFRKAEAERCFCIILIIIQILFWYIPSFLENKIDIDQGSHKR